MNVRTNKMLGALLSSYVSRISENLIYDKLFQTRTAKLLRGLKDGEKVAIEAGLNVLSAAAVANVKGNSILSMVAQTLLVDAGPEITRRMRKNDTSPEEFVQEQLRSDPKTVTTAFDSAFKASPPILTADEYQQILDKHGYTAASWQKVQAQKESKPPGFPQSIGYDTANQKAAHTDGQRNKRRWVRERLAQSTNTLKKRREARNALREQQSFGNRLKQALEFLKRLRRTS